MSVLVLPRKVFESAVLTKYEMKQDEYIDFLKTNAVFSIIDMDYLQLIALNLCKEEHPKNAIIFHENQIADRIYLVEKGDYQIDAIIKEDEKIPSTSFSDLEKEGIRSPGRSSPTGSKRQKVAIVGEGQIFGESEVLKRCVRGTRAIAMSPNNVCYVFDISQLRVLFKISGLSDSLVKSCQNKSSWRFHQLHKIKKVKLTTKKRLESLVGSIDISSAQSLRSSPSPTPILKELKGLQEKQEVSRARYRDDLFPESKDHHSLSLPKIYPSPKYNKHSPSVIDERQSQLNERNSSLLKALHRSREAVETATSSYDPPTPQLMELNRFNSRRNLLFQSEQKKQVQQGQFLGNISRNNRSLDSIKEIHGIEGESNKQKNQSSLLKILQRVSSKDYVPADTKFKDTMTPLQMNSKALLQNSITLSPQKLRNHPNSLEKPFFIYENEELADMYTKCKSVHQVYSKDHSNLNSPLKHKKKGGSLTGSAIERSSPTESNSQSLPKIVGSFATARSTVDSIASQVRGYVAATNAANAAASASTLQGEYYSPIMGKAKLSGTTNKQQQQLVDLVRKSTQIDVNYGNSSVDDLNIATNVQDKMAEQKTNKYRLNAMKQIISNTDQVHRNLRFISKS